MRALSRRQRGQAQRSEQAIRISEIANNPSLRQGRHLDQRGGRQDMALLSLLRVGEHINDDKLTGVANEALLNKLSQCGDSVLGARGAPGDK